MDSIIGIVNLLLVVLTMAIVGRALLSWFDPGMRSAVGKLLYDITEPILRPLRGVIPSFGMFDLTPIIAILLLQFLRMILARAV